MLNYPALLGLEDAKKVWDGIHSAEWESLTAISPTFKLCKLHARIEEFQHDSPEDLIYFDSFSPEKQPELWTVAIFEKMFQLLHPGGRLTTYCAKGDVRRAMLAAGFHVSKEKGPPGKREMLVATKAIV